jgi:hypothetical protein
MWELKRKVIYGLAAFISICAISVLLLRTVLFPAPTCFDGKKNGFEVDVDCGGTCNLMCKQEVKPLTIVWSKAVKASKNMYDLVALVSNNNIDNSAKQIGYMFILYDEQGGIMGTFSGSTTPPLDGTFPIIIQNVPLEKAPKNVVTSLTDGPHYKVLESPASPTIRILSRKYEAGTIPHVYATIANTKRVEINNLPVRAVLFDEQDNAYAVGQTVIPYLGKEGVQDIVFTWGEPLVAAPTRISIYPIFNPFDAKGN